ncbi:MAG TPA: hypothetical protein VL068_11015 [Microthrixaceae bacterium]|nr:hypothetical protein [Microthrixaceae bacterium]
MGSVVVGLAALLTLTAALVMSSLVGVAGASGRQEPSGSTDSAEQIRSETEKVLERPEFSYKKGYLERFLDWLWEKLGWDADIGGPQAVGAFGGGAGTIVAVLILAVAAIGIAFAIVRYIRRRSPKEVEEVEEPTTEVEHSRSAREWTSEAEGFEVAGAWKQAIRARYRLLVRTLIDGGELPDIAGRTTGELRGDIAASIPTASESFDEASTLFELPWYADLETGPAENERFKELASAVLAERR